MSKINFKIVLVFIFVALSSIIHAADAVGSWQLMTADDTLKARWKLTCLPDGELLITEKDRDGNVVNLEDKMNEQNREKGISIDYRYEINFDVEPKRFTLVGYVQDSNLNEEKIEKITMIVEFTDENNVRVARARFGRDFTLPASIDKVNKNEIMFFKRVEAD